MYRLLVNLESNCDFWKLNGALANRIVSELSDFCIEFWGEDEAENIEKLSRCDIYYGWRFETEWVGYAKKLFWVIIPSAGKDYIDVEFLKKNEIVVTSCSFFHGIPMTEQIMSYILGFSRGIFQTFGLQTEKDWWKEEVKEAFFDLYGKKLAIIGCGSVGNRLAEAVKQYNMQVMGVRRNPDYLNRNIEWYTPDKIAEVLKQADIVVNLLPFTEENRDFFNKERFAMMNNCLLYINIGRGQTQNDIDLIEALEQGRIKYCALDVYDPKPPAMDNKLRYMKNVIMTPKTGVFFYHYMDFAVRYFIIMMRKFVELIADMNVKYVEQKYINIAIEKYFTAKRMDNIMLQEDGEKDKFDFLNKLDLFSREELLEKYKATGRNHPFLAFTVNSFCNRNCIFCDAKNHEDKILNLEDYRKIAQAANRWGVTKAHLSGGEPTIRKEIVEIARIMDEELKGPKKQIGITTNGSLSFELIDKLIDAGVNTFNFSVHSLDKDNYESIMGAGDPEDVMKKVRHCLERGVRTKVNCTLMRSYLGDALEIIRLAKDLPLDVRLVELQYIGPAVNFFDKEFISETETLQQPGFREIMEHAYETKDRKKIGVRSPGTYYLIDGWKGSFGFISNTSRPFCADGNRIKITPSGRVRPCTIECADLDLETYLKEDKMDDVFKYLFLNYLNRDVNPNHRGYHYIDVDLRWDNYKFDTKCQ
ncbi:MAG: radical SAM protein [Lachnospiraceae bacterium]|nr:radical SAM protein [Lachnospiraceae bacterium]